MNVKKILLSLLVSMPSFSMRSGDMPAAAQRTSEIPKEIVTSFEAISKQDDQMPGDCKRVIIIGPTGVGKDTLLHYLAGIPLHVAEDELCGVSVAPSAKDAIPGTIMGSGASKTRVPTYVTIGDILFINCPGFFATEGAKQELINAFTIQKVCKGYVKFLFTFKAYEIEGSRCADELRQRFADLVNAFSGNLSNSSGVVLTQMNIDGHCGYKDYIKKLGRYSAVWGGVTEEGERNFSPAYDNGGDLIKHLLMSERFVPFPLPAPDEEYYGNEHRQQIFNMIERIPEYMHLTEGNVRVHMSYRSLSFAYEIARETDVSISTLIETQICPALIMVLDEIKLSCRGNIEALMEKLEEPKKLSEEFFENADNRSISDIYEFLLKFLDPELECMKEFRGMMECVSFAKQINPEFKFITTIWVARLSIVKNWAISTVAEIERSIEAQRKLDALTRDVEAARKLVEETKDHADINRAKSAEDMLKMQAQLHGQMEDMARKNVAERLQAKQEYEAMLTQRENAYRAQQQQMDAAHKKALEDMQTRMISQERASLEQINKVKTEMNTAHQQKINEVNRNMQTQVQQAKDSYDAALQRQQQEIQTLKNNQDAALQRQQQEIQTLKNNQIAAANAARQEAESARKAAIQSQVDAVNAARQEAESARKAAIQSRVDDVLETMPQFRCFSSRNAAWSPGHNPFL